MRFHMTNLVHGGEPTMIQKLRRKFVITAMTSLLIILVLLLGGLNVMNLVQIDQRSNSALETILEGDGFFPGFVPGMPPQGGNGNDGSVGKPMDTSTTTADTMTAAAGAVEPEANTTNDAATDPAAGAENGKIQAEGAGAPSANTVIPDSSVPADEKHPERRRDFEANRKMEAPFETRYFWVKVDGTGTATETFMDRIAAVDEDTAKTYAVEVWGKNQESGYYDGYKFGTKTLSDGTTLVVFLDNSSAFSSAIGLLRMTLLIGLAALALMFVLVWLFAGQAVAPVVESLEKQKRFISDAGHELKTPLSVISANVDVLEMTGEKNDWTKSIRNQTKRMTDLVNNMLTLSRMEEDRVKQIFSDVNLSEIVKENADTYTAVAQSQGKKYDMTIEEHIHMTGDHKSLAQLCTLLLDNAMKYADDHGSIHVNLSKDQKKIRLEVSNTCDQVPEGDLNRLFDRFYRADSSRNRETGGYGIGLSVAKAICQSHGGSITALRDGDRIIRFVATLPVMKQAIGPKNS